MSAVPSTFDRPRREAIGSVLAKNLSAARTIAGLTQQELASAARVSRATVAQIETGVSDPRLSTVVELARGLGVAPVVLLFGEAEVRALARLRQTPPAVTVPEGDVGRMRQLAGSGLLKDRLRAARLGAAAVRGRAGASAAVPVTAGLFSACCPGAGTALGAELARLLE